MSTPPSARLLARLHRGLLRGVVHLAMLPLRAAVALLLWLGVARVTVAVLFVRWAAPIVGLRAAGWLVAIWWAHRLTRHQRARLYRHQLLRKAERALEHQAFTLLRTSERGLAARAITLAGADQPPVHAWPASAPAARKRPAPPASAAPQPAADQPPEQTVAALGRYATGWVARHLAPPDAGTPTRRRWRQPR